MSYSTWKSKYNKFAGYRASWRNTATGAIYILFDGRETDFDTTDGRWVTLCHTHSTICNHSSEKIARSHLPTGGWCETCMREPEEQRRLDNAYALGFSSVEEMEAWEAEPQKVTIELTADELDRILTLVDDKLEWCERYDRRDLVCYWEDLATRLRVSRTSQQKSPLPRRQ